MIIGKNANLMMKYQRTKAKLAEYNVSEQEYPKFALNSDELSYPTTYVLSRYSECVIENNQDELEELKLDLSLVAEYYDSAFKSKDRKIYDLDFLLSGASAYFLNNDFGSAKVLAKRVDGLLIHEKCPQKLLLKVYNYLLDGKYLPYLENKGVFENVNNSFLDYFSKGKSIEQLKSYLKIYRETIYANGGINDVFYVDILCAVILEACKNSLWEILPYNSGLSLEDWRPYLQSKLSIKMLWPAQRLIVEKGLLLGNDALVQLPTGVGKTKSIEIIIRAAFLSNRANNVIIVAPLRALCNEITIDMYRAFRNGVIINQFSDILNNDFENAFIDDVKKKIIVCTPEKLNYILHHDDEFISHIDLFIFDEGHMFDAGGRGATYELLVTHILQNRMERQRIILLSAVLPNSLEIKDWLFEKNGVLATDKRIVSTPKSIGFVSNTKNIHFFSNNKNEEDYYISRILKVEKLDKLPRERKDKFFPDLLSSVDVAIYNAIKLCPNGGVAIYVGQPRSVKTIFEKILYLDKHNYDLSSIKSNANQEELLKIKKFVQEYYGLNHYYTKVVEFGILPHFSTIQNGMKLVAEHALKNSSISCVVCTSTLAQGVNIPIKYLLVTSIRIGTQVVKIRDFQNLIGRTARSGVYTEGSIIITDSKIYDRRNSSQHGGRYIWNDCVQLFDADSVEPCSSSILSLVQDFKLDFEHYITGENFIRLVIARIDEKDFWFNCAQDIERMCLERYPNINKNTIRKEVLLRRDIWISIENYLCLVYCTEESIDKNEISIINICSKTLAYALASDNEKILLENVFVRIEENVKKYSIKQLRKYANAMTSIEKSSEIEHWIIKNELTEKYFSEEELLEKIIDLYLDLNSISKHIEKFKCICYMWVNGKTPDEISSEINIDISEIDDICNKKISYELNFLVGNILDLIDVNQDDNVNEDNIDTLCLLQNKIKYGVPNVTSISICEKIFDDRLMSIKISQILEDENIRGDKILKYIKIYREPILKMLYDYPSYFQDRIKSLVN